MSKYYTAPPQVKNGDVAYAVDVNGLNDGADTGFALVEADILGISATVEAWALLAQKWAENPVDVEVEPGMYSSLHHSDKSSGFADASQISANASEASSVASGISAGESAASAAEALQTLQDVEDEGDVQIARVITEGDTQEARVIAEGTTQVSRVIAEGDTQEARVISEGANQVSLATAQAERAEDAADDAEGWSNLSESYSVDSADSAAQSEGHANNSYQYSLDAQSVACQDLTAIQEKIATSASVVDVFIYDTANDSDGGAWRKRTESLSWYKEDLNTATRGKTREFPSVALIVTEVNKVTIYDATDPTCPMWMVFTRSVGNYLHSNSISSVAMNNGILAIANNGQGIRTANFITDSGYVWKELGGGYAGSASLPISGRNDVSVWSNDSVGIVDNVCNAVAMTVLPDAPIDQSTGIQVPTIGVATDGGVSLIDVPNADPVINSASTASYGDISFNGAEMFFGTLNNAGAPCRYVRDISALADGWAYSQYTTSTFPAVQGISSKSPVKSGDTLFIGSDVGLTHIKENVTTPAEGMVAYQDTEQPPMWQVGDIKGAFLASTTEETIGTDTTTEHVVNGDFATGDLTGWTDLSSGSGTATVVANELSIYRQNGANTGQAGQGFATVIGQTYELSAVFVSGTGHRLFVGTALSGNDILITYEDTATFKAVGTTTYIKVNTDVDGVTAVFDNISVKASQNEVENGEFSSDRAWDVTNMGTGSITGGQLVFTGDTGTVYASQGAIEDGKEYLCVVDYVYTSGAPRIWFDGSSPTDLPLSTQTYSFKATAAGNSLTIGQNATSVFAINSIEIYELSEPDRSYNDNPMQVVGHIDKVPVATGAELVGYKSTTGGYFEQPYNVDMDVGVNDFEVSGWIKPVAGANQCVLQRGTLGGSADNIILVDMVDSSDTLRCYTRDASSQITSVSVDISDRYGLWTYFSFKREATTLKGYINTTQRGEVVLPARDITNVGSILRVGTKTDGSLPMLGEYNFIALSGTVASDEQSVDIYNTEKKMFNQGTKCTLSDGDNVSAVSYDDVSQTLKVGNDDTFGGGATDIFSNGIRIGTEEMIDPAVSLDHDNIRYANAENTRVVFHKDSE